MKPRHHAMSHNHEDEEPTSLYTYLPGQVSIEAKIFLAYQRQLNNLSIQESRLRRQREKDAAALRSLQQLRKQQQAKRLTEAARQYIQAVHEERHDLWEPDENGFEFSLEQVEVRALEIEPDLFAEWAEENAALEDAARKNAA